MFFIHSAPSALKFSFSVCWDLEQNGIEVIITPEACRDVREERQMSRRMMPQQRRKVGRTQRSESPPPWACRADRLLPRILPTH